MLLRPRAPGAGARIASLAAVLWLAAPGARAIDVAPQGCPQFHCDREATSVMLGAVVPLPTSVRANNTLGKLKFQGCSGDGERLACLFDTDSGTPPWAAGTLKVLDATTLRPLWGSAAVAGSYNPAPTDINGQVPLMLADGRIVAADATTLAVYDRAGVAVATLPLTGAGHTYGPTLVGADHAIVAQESGTLTLIDTAAWQVLQVLTLQNPGGGGAVKLMSPQAGGIGVLYAAVVSRAGDRSTVFAVAFDATARRIAVRSSVGFIGRSQFSPVVVPPAMSGLTYPLVLVHTPQLASDPQPVERLMALRDNGLTLTPVWQMAPGCRVGVAPTVDATTQTLFYTCVGDYRVHQAQLQTGAPVRTFDIAALGALPTTMQLNGHLAALREGTVFTLLLSGSVAAGQAGAGQHVFAFQPVERPSALLWAQKIANRADEHTGAWNVAPALQAGEWCPVVVGSTSGITRLCDFTR